MLPLVIHAHIFLIELQLRIHTSNDKRWAKLSKKNLYKRVTESK